MRTMWARHFLLALLGAAVAAAGPSFRGDVLPILERRCQACHQGENAQARLTLTSAAALLRGGASGPAISPDAPDASLLLARAGGPKPSMPPLGEPLTEAERRILRDWIAAGAEDDGQAGVDDDGVWWSLRPLERPPVPSGSAPWARNAVDRFVGAKLAENGLGPSPEADRRTLIRRLSFDLHGLPPMPDEVSAFVEDPAPDAYERLVERLLASPRYGERWARHWLDAVHYGESHGYDKDKPRRNAWPYRDYVIRSLNEDKPYARFVREQIAGDALWPDSAEALVATGMLAAGPWDFVGHAELREGTKDKNIARLLDRDDMLMTVMSTFTSLTVHCARCHDHKFDPISQSDYYALQAVFAGVDRADRPFDDDPEVFAVRRDLLDRLRRIETEIEPLEERLTSLTTEAIESHAAEIEELRKRRTLLNHEKTAGATQEERQRNARLDAESRELAAEIARLEASIREIRLSLLPPAERERLAALRDDAKRTQAEFDALPEPHWVYAAAPYFKGYGRFTPARAPRPVHRLERGDVESPREAALPGAVSAVGWLPARFELAEPADEGARRAALADWIADPRNPLAWRSIVNRVWLYHFGKGLADSPNDFGRMGERPTHPELLDWLAVEFRDSGGSLKALHRLLVTSATYRQASAANPRAERIDAGNRLWWRMDRRRLDAESTRDAVLAVSGGLDLTMGGPSEEHFFFHDDHSPVYDYARFDPAAAGALRRSVYRFIVRSAPDPWMESLDCPDPSLLAPKRGVTLTAVQALALLNDPLVIERARRMAEALRTESDDPAEQVAALYARTLQRTPRAEETRLLARFGDEHGLENLCRLVLNSNEFLFID